LIDPVDSVSRTVRRLCIKPIYSSLWMFPDGDNTHADGGPHASDIATNRTNAN
jgi:hypothetical protein